MGDVSITCYASPTCQALPENSETLPTKLVDFRENSRLLRFPGQTLDGGDLLCVILPTPLLGSVRVK